MLVCVLVFVVVMKGAAEELLNQGGGEAATRAHRVRLPDYFTGKLPQFLHTIKSH